MSDPDPEIQAIPTTWRGWSFRSRLEGRWAVCWTVQNIEFWYEPKGFILSDGVWYLPDFYLPKVNAWAEVKPTEFSVEERRKCELVVTENKCTCLLLVGPPDFKAYTGISYDAGLPTECLYSLDVDWRKRDAYEREGRLFSPPEQITLEDDFSKQYREAVYASRGERFGAHE